MAIKWSINQLDYEISKDSKSNVVTSVHWNANDSKEVTKDGEKVTYSGRSYGQTGLDTSDLSSFVAYDKLDEDTVVKWVKASLGEMFEIDSLMKKVIWQADSLGIYDDLYIDAQRINNGSN